jgi:hypothetical protein
MNRHDPALHAVSSYDYCSMQYNICTLDGWLEATHPWPSELSKAALQAYSLTR